jgi:hypothetical protein
MFRNFVKTISNKSYLIKPFPSAKSFVTNKTEYINEKLYDMYWIGTIPSGLGVGTYMANKVVEENLDKTLMENYVRASVVGICGAAAGVVLWLSLPLTGPIFGLSYMYNKLICSKKLISDL